MGGKREYEVVLPPKRIGGPTRTRRYRSPKTARAAQQRAWAAWKDKENLHAALGASGMDPRFRQCNPTEQAFIAAAQSHGCEVHRSGWPDFVLRTPTGLKAVEVKPEGGTLKRSQIQCFKLLEEAGLEVWIWTPGSFARWNEYLRGQLRRAAGVLKRPDEPPKGGNEGTAPHHANLAPGDRIHAELAPSAECEPCGGKAPSLLSTP